MAEVGRLTTILNYWSPFSPSRAARRLPS